MHLLDLVKEMDNTPEFIRARKSMRHRRSLTTLENNSKRLLDALAELQKIRGTLISPDGIRYPAMHIEILRNTFNYIVTALAIVDHLKAVDEDVYGQCGENERPKLKKIMKEFKLTLSYQFAHGLRQYMLHYSFPTLSFDGGAYALTSKSLLKWDGWKDNNTYKQAFDFLNKNGGIHLRALINNYFLDLKSFFSKYDIAQHKHLAREYEIYNRLVNQYNSMKAEAISSIVNSDFNKVNSTFESLETNLIGSLDSSLWERILESKSTLERGEAMIVSLKEQGVKFDENKVRALYKTDTTKRNDNVS